MSLIKTLIKSEQAVLFTFIIGVCSIIGILNPDGFFTWNTLFDLLRNSTVHGILAISVLIIMIYGGVDLSFSAVAAFSSYVSVTVINAWAPEAPLALIVLLCVAIGVGLGILNAVMVTYSRLPILVVTLATSSMIYGFLLFFISNKIIMKLPPALAELKSFYILSIKNEYGYSNLHVTILVLIVLAAGVAIYFNYINNGRLVFAVGGGGRELAARVGVNVRKQDIIVFSLSAVIAALAGICNTVVFRYANPVIFRGEELDIIAAVVIGGASINGGKGSVFSTLMGVVLINLVKNNLVMINVPSSWQKAIIGMIIILGTAYNVFRAGKGDVA